MREPPYRNTSGDRWAEEWTPGMEAHNDQQIAESKAAIRRLVAIYIGHTIVDKCSRPGCIVTMSAVSQLWTKSGGEFYAASVGLIQDYSIALMELGDLMWEKGLDPEMKELVAVARATIRHTDGEN